MRKLLALFIFLSTFSVNAQYEKKIIEDAESHFLNGNFEKAYSDYHYVSTIFPEKKDEIDFRLKVSFYLSEGRNLPPRELHDLDIDEAELNFWLGRVYFESYDFKSAINYFQDFINVADENNESIETANYYIDKANYILSQPENKNWVLRQLSEPYNSEYSEVSPIIDDQSKRLIFFSSRPTQELYVENQYHLFNAEIKGKKTTSTVQLNDKIGDFDLLNSRICLDNDNNLYFTDKLYSNVIYTASLSDPQWQDNAVPFIKLKNGLAFDSHFFINGDADQIIFSSATNGQVDLYMMKLEKATENWSNPELLPINTEYNEDSPFLNEAGNKLYFSSDRPDSFGGYDVYSCTFDIASGSWLSPQNMGYPINTIDDDIDFVLDNEGETGFITSDRKESIGEYDIFFLTKSNSKEEHPFLKNIQIPDRGE